MPCWNKRPIKEAHTIYEQDGWDYLKGLRASRGMIERWWTKWPNAQIALICGKISGVTVIDLDKKVDRQKWPDTEPLDPDTIQSRLNCYTVSSITGTGGKHLFCSFTDIPNSVQTVAPQIDIRSEGGYAILPPSMHHETRTAYTWDSLFPWSSQNLTALANVPMNLRTQAKRFELQGVDWARVVSGSAEGGRNQAGVHMAGRIARLFRDDPGVAWEAFQWWNKTRCTPPMDDREARNEFNSVMKREYAKSRKAHGGGRVALS